MYREAGKRVITPDAARQASDYELAQRVVNGEKTAFNALYENNYSKVFGQVLSIVQNAARAEEITQEAFARAWKNIATFNGGAAFSTWVSKIAQNLSIDETRARRRRPATKDEVYETTMKQAEPDAELSLLIAEDRERITQALNSLDPGVVEILRMRFFDEMSHKEIAARTGMLDGTVMSKVFYGRKKLLAAYNDLVEKEHRQAA